jgi:hypothetical protein
MVGWVDDDLVNELACGLQRLGVVALKQGLLKGCHTVGVALRYPRVKSGCTRNGRKRVIRHGGALSFQVGEPGEDGCAASGNARAASLTAAPATSSAAEKWN